MKVTSVKKKAQPKFKASFNIYRKGRFVVNGVEDVNQCRAVGHNEYFYEVNIEVEPVLDDMGFIIDHAKIHETMLMFEKDLTIGSCEQIAQKASKRLYAICPDYFDQVMIKMVIDIYPTESPVSKMRYEVSRL